MHFRQIFTQEYCSGHKNPSGLTNPSNFYRWSPISIRPRTGIGKELLTLLTIEDFLENLQSTVSYPLNWIDTGRVISQNKHIKQQATCLTLIQSDIVHRSYETSLSNNTTHLFIYHSKLNPITSELHHPTMIKSSIALHIILP